MKDIIGASRTCLYMCSTRKYSNMVFTAFDFIEMKHVTNENHCNNIHYLYSEISVV